MCVSVCVRVSVYRMRINVLIFDLIAFAVQLCVMLASGHTLLPAHAAYA